MKSIKYLATMSAGAFLVSAAYAFVVGDQHAEFSMDSDDGRHTKHIVDGDRGEFSMRDDERAMKAKWRGAFTLNDDGTGLEALDRTLTIEFKEDGVTERVEYENDDDQILTRYSLDDDEEGDVEAAAQAASELLLRFLRASGMKADERVKMIATNGGSAAVFDEVEQLTADHARRRYAVALAEQETLSADEIGRLAGAVSSIESDHDLSRALQAILEHQEITADAADKLIAAADSIESDHDLRKLVEAFSERMLTGENIDPVLTLYERLESDHDLRRAAEELLENDAVNNAAAARILNAAAGKIESDHDMRNLLEELSGRINDGAIASAWMAGYATLESSHDQRVALEAIAAQAKRDETLMAAYRGAVSKIDSEYDRERALEAIGEE